jgi:hypothetical protein
VRKALVTVLSMWCFHVVALSKVTPRQVTLFTRGISRPFSCSTSSETLKSSVEIDRLSFPFIELYVPALTPRIDCSEAAFQLQLRVSLSRKYTYHPRTEQDVFQVLRGNHLYIDCTILGQGRNLQAPLPLFLLA